MADTYTTSIRLRQPQVGADTDAWGGFINTDLTLIDSAINGKATVSLTGLSTYTLTANNGAADEAREAVYSFTGSLSGNCTVTLPAVSKMVWAVNSTTGSHNVILTTGGGTTATVRPDGNWYLIYCDGTNVTFEGIALQSISVAGNATIAGNASVGGNLTVAGAATVVGALNALTLSTFGDVSIGGNLHLSNNATVSGALNVVGNETVAGDLHVTGNAFAANGTTSTQLVNFSQFPVVTGTTGTTTLPNGLIMKWGTGATSSGTGTVSFGVAFPTSCDNAQVTATGASGTLVYSPLAIATLSASGFAVFGKSGETIGFDWFAIGH